MDGLPRTPSCSCDGSNPDCYKCCGTGFLRSARNNPGAPLKPGGESSRKTIAGKSLPVTDQRVRIYAVVCPGCSFAGTEVEFWKHIASYPKHIASETRVPIPCPFCKAKFDPLKFGKHTRLAHPNGDNSVRPRIKNPKQRNQSCEKKRAKSNTLPKKHNNKIGYIFAPSKAKVNNAIRKTVMNGRHTNVLNNAKNHGIHKGRILGDTAKTLQGINAESAVPSPNLAKSGKGPAVPSSRAQNRSKLERTDFPEPLYEGQRKFEGGLQWSQAGIPGLGKRR